MWYKEASKNGTGIRAGEYGLGMRRKFSFSLGQYVTTFLAEVYAIKARVLENINRNIYTKLDSQTALQALVFSRLTQN
jgi:hypothetical protein